jgi:all-trans-retinol 13,14-reductase
MKKIIVAHVAFCLLVTLFTGCDFLRKQTIDVAAKQDWQVSCDLSKTKAQNEFDVIVVGAGIGGLSCASLLATSGYKTLVLEQQHQVGGYCTSFQRDGFTFQAGPHDISGVEQGAVKMLLDKLNLNKNDLFALHTRTYVFGDKKICFTGTKNDVVQKLSACFPREQQTILDFFNEAEKAIIEYKACKKGPTQSYATYKQWMAVTYQQKLDAFFHDAELKKFLCSLLGYLGTPPDKTIAGNALMACLSYFIYGGYYPKKGGSLFAETLRKVIESHDGTVLTDTCVDEILINDDHQIIGVRAGNKAFRAPIVVANANAKTTFLNLIPRGKLDPAFVEAIANLKMSPSGAAVHLGVDLDLSQLTSIVDVGTGEDEIGFTINSNADATTAPRGKASISMGVHASYADVPPSGTLAYETYKKELADAAIAKIEKVIPGLSKHIIVINVVTPRTFEQFTSMPEGSLYAFDQSAGSRRPYFKTPIKGLYLASASTVPGGGVEAVVASGLICAHDILAAQVKQKK